MLGPVLEVRFARVKVDVNDELTIKVPATSANIGPGFDVVGLSLSLHLTLTVPLTTT